MILKANFSNSEPHYELEQCCCSNACRAQQEPSQHTFKVSTYVKAEEIFDQQDTGWKNLLLFGWGEFYKIVYILLK